MNGYSNYSNSAGAISGADASPARDASPVEGAASSLAYEQSNTRDLLDRLEARLQSVLTPTAPTPPMPDKSITGAPPPRSPMTQAFGQCARDQTNVNERLRALIDRIEL